MKLWNKTWKSSKKPKKQRKYALNSPLHIKRKLMSVHLVKTLRDKYQKRNIPARKGDTVKIMTGQFRGKSGKVERVDLKHRKVYVENASLIKRDGSKKPYPIDPSNLMITDLIIEDKLRKKALEKK